jgi:hypothetical protein
LSPAYEANSLARPDTLLRDSDGNERSPSLDRLIETIGNSDGISNRTGELSRQQDRR